MSTLPHPSRPWAGWLAHFERQRLRPLPARAMPVDRFPGAQALARSLARFQLGEAGEGRLAHQIHSVSIPGIDADYRRALQLFVAEEGRHGRVLAGMVRALGGTLLTRHWTTALFTAARRLLGGVHPMGVRFKLMVLLVAEILGIAFYRLVTPVVPAGPLRRALREICRDEAAHLRFHSDFFAASVRRGPARVLWGALLWGTVVCAVWVVLVDHAPALGLLPRGRRRLVGQVFRLTGMTWRSWVLGPAASRFGVRTGGGGSWWEAPRSAEV
jgi:hypothetical protein